MTDGANLVLQIAAGIAAAVGVHLYVPAVRNDLPAATLFSACIATMGMAAIVLLFVGMSSTLPIGLAFSFGIGALCALPVLLLLRLLRKRG